MKSIFGGRQLNRWRSDHVTPQGKLASLIGGGCFGRLGTVRNHDPREARAIEEDLPANDCPSGEVNPGLGRVQRNVLASRKKLHPRTAGGDDILHLVRK